MKDSEIDDKILRYLSKCDWPVTTQTIARALNISWNTAQIHLYRLLSEGKVKSKRAGGQNQWMLTKQERS